MSDAFDWIDVHGGRARFCGLVRGGDEAGHDVFAVDRSDEIAYGEMAATGEGNRYSVAVISYGFPRERAVGAPYDVTAYSGEEAIAVERCIRDLVATVAARPSRRDRPSILHFLPDEVIFRDSWIRIDAATSSTNGTAVKSEEQFIVNKLFEVRGIVEASRAETEVP